MQALKLILCVLLLTACEGFDSTYSRLALDCGSDADERASYVKILDDKGETMNADRLMVRVLSGPVREEKATRRGCVRVDQLPVVVSDNSADGVWGLALDADTIPLFRKAKLVDIRQLNVEASCSELGFTQGSILNPAKAPQGLAAVFPLQFKVNQASLQESLQLQGDALALPASITDGELDLNITYENYFRRNASAPPAIVCKYRLDRQKPIMSSSLNATIAEDTFIVQPGEKILLRSDDDSPSRVYHCLRKKEDKAACQDTNTFSVTDAQGSLQAPDSGHWCLESFAYDQAGNISDKNSQCFIAFQSSEIENIHRLADTARLQVEEDEIAASISLLRALEKFEKLPTPEEKAAVESDIFAASVRVNSSVQEFQRSFLPQGPEAMAVLDAESFVILDRQNLNLWGDTGKLLDRFPLPTAADTARIASVGARILLTQGPAWTLLEKQGDRLQIISRGDFQLPISSASFSPSGRAFLLLSSEGDEGKASLFAIQDGKVSEEQSFPSRLAEFVVWAANEEAFVLARFDFFELYRKKADGFQVESFQEEAVIGGTFLNQKDQEFFVYMNADRQLKKWIPEAEPVLLQDAIDSPDFSDTSFRRLLRIGDSSALILRESGVFQIELSATDDQIKPFATEPGLSNQMLSSRISDWRWNEIHQRLSVVIEGVSDAPTKAYAFQAIPGLGEWLATQVLQLKNRRIIHALTLAGKSLSVTFDNTGFLRYWTERSSNQGYRVTNTESEMLRWFPRPGQEPLLINAIYNGSFRMHDADGNGLSTWVHNPIPALSITDIAWNQKQDRILSCARDGRTVVWNSEGKQLAVLDDVTTSGKSGAKNRYTAAFLQDQRSVITAGDKVFGLWREQSDRSYALQRHFFETNFGAHARPGDARSFLWDGKEYIWAARRANGSMDFAFFDSDGQPAPFWTDKSDKELAAFDLSPDASMLALSYLGEAVRFYQLKDYTYQEVGSSEKLGLDWTRLSREMVWSPDGRFLAAALRGDRVILWERTNEGLRLHAEHKLQVGNGGAYLLRWSKDSSTLSFVYQNEIHVLDNGLKAKLPPLRPFSLNEGINGLDLSEDGRMLAVTAAGRVRVIRIEALPVIRQMLCQRFKQYLSSTAPGDSLCAP